MPVGWLPFFSAFARRSKHTAYTKKRVTKTQRRARRKVERLSRRRNRSVKCKT